MKKVQILSISLVVVALVIAATYYAHSAYVCNTEKIEAPIGVSISTISKIESTRYAKINIEYPKILGVNEKINTKISDYVNISLDEFNKNAEENWKARVATSIPSDNISEFPSDNEKFEFIAEWELSQLNNDKVSLLLTIYQFSGGAHGSTIQKSFNYDINNQKELTLKDLFNDDVNYLNKVSAYSIANLKEQFVGNEMANEDSIKEGAGPKIENFEIFTVNRNKLTFYFPQYSIGPYALGIKTVEMYNWNNSK